MSTPKWLGIFSLLLVVVALAGCARTARNTEGFAITDTATVNAPFADTWQTVKEVLREKNYDIYTRDKRGVFVAFTKMKRNMIFVPKRTKYTISLQAASDSSTEVTVESIHQVFGVTLLTYPGWHDRPTTDHAAAQEMLAAIQAKKPGASEATAVPAPEAGSGKNS